MYYCCHVLLAGAAFFFFFRQVKLADFGTADVDPLTVGTAVEAGHFTTLENTPMEQLCCGSDARQVPFLLLLLLEVLWLLLLLLLVVMVLVLLLLLLLTACALFWYVVCGICVFIYDESCFCFYGKI